MKGSTMRRKKTRRRALRRTTSRASSARAKTSRRDSRRATSRRTASSSEKTPRQKSRVKKSRVKKSRVKKTERRKLQRTRVISRNITRSMRLGKGIAWVIAAEVRVAAGATLTVADGATILIRNGRVPQSRIRRAALIFDPGSRLVAKRFSVRACGADDRPAKVSDNGGIWFLGTHHAGASDGISVRKVPGAMPSLYRARAISTAYLGRLDVYDSPATGRVLDIGDDIDGFKLIGVGPEEWKVSEVRTSHAGDDGFDLTNSRIELDRLVVRHPTEDGLNVSSSRLAVRKSLVLEVIKTKETDRDLFDLETDDGASYVELIHGCRVKVRGVFGDQVHLVSKEMPVPDVRADHETPYRFDGRLKRDALVFSITED